MRVFAAVFEFAVYLSGIAPVAGAWWAIVRLRTRPVLVARYDSFVTPVGDTVLMMHIRNEPEYNKWLVYAGVRREALDDVFCAESLYDVDRGRFVSLNLPKVFHDQSGAHVETTTLTPSAISGLDFTVANFDPLFEATTAQGREGEEVILAPGMYEYQLWFDSHPGARTFKKRFYVLRARVPPLWSSY